jgi:hypothetical protein
MEPSRSAVERNTKFKRQEHVMEVQIWPIEKLIFYARNPRKNERLGEVWDAAA